MRDTKRVPKDDVGVVEVLVGVGLNPSRNSLRRLSRSLGNVAACWVDLVVVI